MAEVITVSAVLLAVLGLIAPVPPFLIDVFVVANLLLAFLSLVLSISVKDILQLSSFPALLLANTVFRVCLSIAATRSILGSAEAGDVIKVFGEILLGGNVLVGVVVYLLITIVQFFVIAKGAERVAEVSARFTLDSLPGRQMSIDADVRMGLIDPDSAKKKRAELLNESRFFGALDGTMKFVKGDAIAGLFIVAVNLLGGVAVGILYRDLSFSDSISTFATLSVGEGLISQIPSFLNGLAAGFLVSRIERDDQAGLGAKMFRQLMAPVQPKFILGVICLVIAVASPLPSILFTLAACILFAVGLIQRQIEQLNRKMEVTLFSPRIPYAIVIQGSELQKVTQLTEALKEAVFTRYSIPISRIGYEQGTKYRLFIRGKELWSRTDVDDFSTAIEEILPIISEYLPDLVDERTVYSLQSIWESQRGVSSIDQGISVFKCKEIIQQLLRQGVMLTPIDVAVEALFNLPANIEVEDGVQEVRKRLIPYALQDCSEKTVVMLDHEDSLEIEEMLIEGSVLPFEAVRRLKSLINDDSNTILVAFKNTANYLRKVLNLSQTKVVSLDEIPDRLDTSKISVVKIFDSHVTASG